MTEEKGEKVNKVRLSNAINKELGLSGDEMINFTKLTERDLVDLQMMLSDPDRALQIAKTLAIRSVPTDARNGLMDMLSNGKKLISFIGDAMKRRSDAKHDGEQKRLSNDTPSLGTGETLRQKAKRLNEEEE